MDQLRGDRIISGVDGDDQIQLAGPGNDPFVPDIVNQDFLVIRMKLDALEAQFLDGIEFSM